MESWAQLVPIPRWDEEDEEDEECCVSGPVCFPDEHGQPQPVPGVHLPNEPRGRCRLSICWSRRAGGVSWEGWLSLCLVTEQGEP